MDSLWFLIACLAFFWVVLWALRDFSKPSDVFWPFDAGWMKRPEQSPPKRQAPSRPGARRRRWFVAAPPADPRAAVPARPGRRSAPGRRPPS